MERGKKGKIMANIFKANMLKQIYLAHEGKENIPSSCWDVESEFQKTFL